MRPGRIDDPRDNLEKATRWELYDYAKQVGCTDVKEPMPHMLAASLLRARGYTNIQVSAPPLGSVSVLGSTPHVPADRTVSAIDELKRQYEQQLANPDPPPFDAENATFNEIRAELKRRGVKLSRKDTLDVLKAKLNGQDAA